jgi:large subunit ribosomal protein L4
MIDTTVETRPSVLVERCNDAGDLLGVVQLDLEYFGAPVNVPLLHQVVTAQLAAKRSGTHSTKTRAEVAGGGAKPYRQKGTGRARQGTIRAPQFAGGGVAFGPKPRDYSQSTPRKMVRQALRAALSDRAAEGRVCLVDRWSYEVPKTKQALASLTALGMAGHVLVVLGNEDVVAERSFGNLPHVNIVQAGQLTAYDVVVSDWVVFTDETVPGQVSDAPEGAVVLNSSRPLKSEDAAVDEDEAVDEDATVDEVEDEVAAGSEDAEEEISEADAVDEVEDEVAAGSQDADDADDDDDDEPAEDEDADNSVGIDEGEGK